MIFTHIRHATSILKINNIEFLTDPFLSEKGSLPPVIFSRNKLRNPLTDLPVSANTIFKNSTHILVTHTHFDHFDKNNTPKDFPIVCWDNDTKNIRKSGFKHIIPIRDEIEISGIQIKRFPAIHGKGFVNLLMGKCSSFLLKYNDLKIFIAGDCIWTSSLKKHLLETAPDFIIVNGGRGSFTFGKPMTLSVDDIKEIAGIMHKSKIGIVHLNTLNHCIETREFCKEQTREMPNIFIPEDGETIIFD